MLTVRSFENFKMELKIVLCAVCLFVIGTDAYRVAVVDHSLVNENELDSIISRAAKLNVHILMLPEISVTAGANTINIQKVKEVISNAARRGRIYVGVQTLDSSSQGRDEKDNLIFDRNGTALSYRNPVGGHNMTTIETFTSDFGVTFGIIMEEDLLIENLAGQSNVIAFGSSTSEARFLFARQFPSSWSFATKSNLITAAGVYGGRITADGDLVVADVNSDSKGTFTVEPLKTLAYEDLSQYTTKPLIVSGRVDKLSVCHGSFCCHFHVKSDAVGELPYSLVAFDGVQDVGSRAIGVQTCAVVACVGRPSSCYDELQANTKSVIQRISISANFNRNSTRYPVITPSSYDDIKFKSNDESTTIELVDKDFFSFGILARDASKDLTHGNMNWDLTEMAAENFQEFFDYVWIRLRVVIFVVSIYILEML